MNMNKINSIKTEILAYYSNTQYQHITKEKKLDNARGTRLWKLWYGEYFDDFCVRMLEYFCKQCEQGKLEVHELEQKIITLRDDLKNEFKKLKIEKEN